MKNKIGFAFFWVSYHLSNLVTKFRKKRPKKAQRYFLVIMGRYPDSLNTVLKSVMVPNSEVRYGIGVNTLLVKFQSSHKLRALDEILFQSLQMQVDNYIVLHVTKLSTQFFGVNLNELMYRKLLSPPPPRPPLEPGMIELSPLDEMQMILTTLQNTRMRMNNIIEEVKREMLEETDLIPEEMSSELDQTQLEEEVDRIIDKINAEGYESLTAEEKTILNKYSK